MSCDRVYKGNIKPDKLCITLNDVCGFEHKVNIKEKEKFAEQIKKMFFTPYQSTPLPQENKQKIRADFQFLIKKRPSKIFEGKLKMEN